MEKKQSFVMCETFLDSIEFFSDEEFMEAIVSLGDYALRGIAPSSQSANVRAWCKSIMPLVDKANKNYVNRVKENNRENK